MAIQFITVRCPKCGANLNLEENRESAFCSYCGTKIILHNENEYVYRKIDEAGIKQAETDRLITLKKMELAEKRMAESQRAKRVRIIIPLAMAAIGIILTIVGFVAGSGSGGSSNLGLLAAVGLLLMMGSLFVFVTIKKQEESDDDYDFGDTATVPSSVSDYTRKTFTEIEILFASAGFTNIRTMPLNDLKNNRKAGLVSSITIKGKEIRTGGKKYPKDVPVIICYHSLNQ